MSRSWWRVLTTCGLLEKGMANHFSILPWEPHEQYDRAKRQATERWTPQVSKWLLCYWHQRRNNSRKNEEMEPKQKQHPGVDVTGDGSKVRGYKEHYCIGTWNVRSMNQGKLEVVKQEAARVNINIHTFSSVAQSCPSLCDPMNRSTPGLPVHHQLPEFTQTHVHRVSDTI